MQVIDKKETGNSTVSKVGGHLRLEKDRAGDSPQIGLRLPATLHRQLTARAEAEKLKISEVARDAIAKYLNS